jgi:hypothetical protein
MDHVGLSHNLKSQVFCAIIKVSQLMFRNLIINDNTNVMRFLNDNLRKIKILGWKWN